MQTLQVKSPVSDDNPKGFIVINASDFDASVHQPFSKEDAAIVQPAEVDADAKPAKAKK